MAHDHRTVVSKDGTKLWADAAGDPGKPAVIFIHGFSGSASHFERQFADANLLGGLYLVRYDLRGHGRSDQPCEASAYVSIRQAEDYKAICEAFGVKKPFLAAWSYGGIIGADICAAYGAESISGIILLAAIPYRSIYAEVVNPWIQDLTPRLLTLDVATFSQACSAFVDSFVSDDFPVPDETRWFWAGAVATQHPLVRQLILGREQDEAAIKSARKTLPFLVIQGTADKHLLVDNMEKSIKSRFDIVEFLRMEGVGHAAFYEQPETVNRTILAFIQRIVAKANVNIL